MLNYLNSNQRIKIKVTPVIQMKPHLPYCKLCRYPHPSRQGSPQNPLGHYPYCATSLNKTLFQTKTILKLFSIRI